MEVELKLTKVQHDQLIEWFGDDESARQWVQTQIENELRKLAQENCVMKVDECYSDYTRCSRQVILESACEKRGIRPYRIPWGLS